MQTARRAVPTALQRMCTAQLLTECYSVSSYFKLCFVRGQAQGNSPCSIHLGATILSFCAGLEGSTNNEADGISASHDAEMDMFYGHPDCIVTSEAGEGGNGHTGSQSSHMTAHAFL